MGDKIVLEPGTLSPQHAFPMAGCQAGMGFEAIWGRVQTYTCSSGRGIMIDGRHLEDPADLEAEFLVEAIAEQFLEQLRAGEAPDKRALASMLPRIGDLLEKHLSLIELLYAARQFPMREGDQASRPER